MTGRYVALRRTLATLGVALAMLVPTAAVASAQSQTDSILAYGPAAMAEPSQPAPPDTHCYPLSLLCGFQMQIGPFGPFDFDFLPGGSVFPPTPPNP